MCIVRLTMAIKNRNYNMKVQSFNRNLNPNKYFSLLKDSLWADTHSHTHNVGINLIKLVVVITVDCDLTFGTKIRYT